MNSRNKSIRRRARPAAGAAFCPAGEGDSPAARPRFSCKIGRCPISGAGVFSPVAERAAWSAAIAQLVEHVIRNDGVTGANLVCGTTFLEAESAGKCNQKPDAGIERRLPLNSPRLSKRLNW